MESCLAIQMCDYYKFAHASQYDPSITKLVSYYTPRSSRLSQKKYVVNFGIQAFCIEYLIEKFYNQFFSIPKEDVEHIIRDFLSNTLPGLNVDEEVERILKLHDLQYLPISIRTLPEGSKVLMGCPCIEMVTTHPEFSWIGGFIESLLSSYIWKPMIDATVGHWYREVVNEYYELAADDWQSKSRSAMSEFGFRGADSPESGIHSGAGWLLSFNKTATCAAIPFISEYYNEDNVGQGLISTEHSVMCSYAQLYMRNEGCDQREAEKKTVHRLLTEIYPHSNFSMVSDSYDYWRMVTEIIPELKEEVMDHDGTLFVRGDSGDPVKIVAGYLCINKYLSDEELEMLREDEYLELNMNTVSELYNKLPYAEFIGDILDDICFVKIEGTYYKVEFNYEEYSNFNIFVINLGGILTETEVMGTVSCLFNTFGGSMNNKGYLVLDSHIRAIYGDSITQRRAEAIYSILIHKGFSPENVALGAGSFSFHAFEGSDYKLYPYTRDTFGAAIKATYGETNDGKILMIYKDPKTNNNSDVIKKSMKGCCAVYENNDGFCYLDHDGLTLREREMDAKIIFEEIFKDGKMITEYSFSEIRNILNEGEF